MDYNNITYFEHLNPAGPVTTGMEAKIDDLCLKITLSYNAEDKSKYCVHYLGINKVRELKDYLDRALIQLEEELLLQGESK